MESGSNFILLAEKLNQNCLNNRIFEDKISFWLPWHDYELSTDIEKCRDFCLKKEYYDDYNILDRDCQNCKETLEKEIRFIYNKTPMEEIQFEIKNLQKRLEIFEGLLQKYIIK